MNTSAWKSLRTEPCWEGAEPGELVLALAEEGVLFRD